MNNSTGNNTHPQTSPRTSIPVLITRTHITPSGNITLKVVQLPALLAALLSQPLSTHDPNNPHVSLTPSHSAPVPLPPSKRPSLTPFHTQSRRTQRRPSNRPRTAPTPRPRRAQRRSRPTVRLPPRLHAALRSTRLNFSSLLAITILSPSTSPRALAHAKRMGVRLAGARRMHQLVARYERMTVEDRTRRHRLLWSNLRSRVPMLMFAVRELDRRGGEVGRVGMRMGGRLSQVWMWCLREFDADVKAAVEV